MIGKKISEILWKITLICSLILFLLYFVGAVSFLFGPIEVWLFMGACAIWAFSLEAVFDYNEDKFTRFVCLLLVIGLPLGFYFVISNAS